MEEEALAEVEDARPWGMGHLEVAVVLNDQVRSHVADREGRGIDHQTMGVGHDQVGHDHDCSYRMTAHDRYHHDVRTEDLADHSSAPVASASGYHVGTLAMAGQVCLEDSAAAEVDEATAGPRRLVWSSGPSGCPLEAESLAVTVRGI